MASSPMPVRALRRGTEYELWVKASPGDPNGTMRKFTLQDLELFGLEGSLDDGDPCSMCETNQGVLRYDHTTDDHANYETGP